METQVKPGRYVVAVSGGVDSMVLLDLLRKLPDVELVVAHFDHGIRPDSSEDRKLVQKVAEAYGLPFAYETAQLGAGASEAEARTARYAFLERVRSDHQARAIITAHHQDDLLETAILNLLRGTGRKGLTSLADRPHIMRPLLPFTKQEIRAYAEQHRLEWREDSTNADDRYMRNYIRHQIIPALTPDVKRQLHMLLRQTGSTNRKLDTELATLLSTIGQGALLDRQAFVELPHDIAKELLASWLRQQGITDFDRQTLERVVVAAKTKPPGTQIDILHDISLLVTRDELALRACER